MTIAGAERDRWSSSDAGCGWNEIMKSATSNEYGPVAKALHWVTVLLVIVAWSLGTFGDDLSEGSARNASLLTHIWIGLTILLLAVVRIPWRIANPPPKIVPTEFGRWLVEWTNPVSRIMHYVLYALLVLVPAAGIALQFARGHSLPIFGLAEISSPWIADKAFASNLKEVHEVLANLLVILALFHMTAALVHHWIFGDTTLRRMLPRLHKQA
jgi:cytochrome b561